jgi:two-component system phosphate regulon sensor histidine kinase PhoR
LLEVSTAVSSSLELDKVLGRLAEQMGQAIDATSAYIADWHRDSDLTTVLAEYYGPEATATETVSDLGQTYNTHTDFDEDWEWLSTLKPTTGHVDDPHLPVADRDHMLRYGAKSILYIPLVTRDEVVGYAELWESRSKRDFTPEEIALCQAMAQQAAIALANARLYEETSQHADELEILHRVALATSAVVNVDKLIGQTTELIAATLYPEIFGFVLLNEENRTLVPHPSYHGIPGGFHGALIPVEHSIVGQVVRTGEPYIVSDVSKDPRYFEGVPSTQSEIAVPLKVHDRVIGAINVESPRLNAYTEDDARFLVTLAGQVAAALERARLYATVQNHAADLVEEVAIRTAELESERDRTLTILDSAGESIFLTDDRFHISYVNPAFEQQSGYARDELLNRTPLMLENERTPIRVKEAVWRAISQGASWSGEMVNRRKDGTFYEVAMTISPIHGSEGALAGFVGVLSDISRLKEIDRLKSQFVSNVSHELRTPLTNIKMYLTLLARGREERRQHYLDVLDLETDRLESLIQDLLDLSRLDTQPMPDQPSSTSLLESVRNQQKAHDEQASERQISLKLDINADLPPVAVNHDHLEMLLANLIANAVTYTPAGGRVVVRAGTGELNDASMAGIAAEELPHLFDRFYRGSAALASGAPGTGLGLAVCKEIVTRYGGEITVESEPGRETCFTAWLPVAD